MRVLEALIFALYLLALVNNVSVALGGSSIGALFCVIRLLRLLEQFLIDRGCV